MQRVIFPVFFLSSLIILTIIACNDHDEVGINEIISVSISNDIKSIPADGTSKALIRTSIPKVMENKSIKLFTTAGVFSNSSKEVEGVAFLVDKDVKYFETSLTAPLAVDTAEIYAKVDDYYSNQVELVFSYSEPTSILLSSSKIGLPRSFAEEVTITASVTSGTGLATQGQNVDFKFYFNGDETSVGTSSIPAKTNSIGSISFNISGGSLPEEGILEIRAYLKKNPSIFNNLEIIVFNQ